MYFLMTIQSLLIRKDSGNVRFSSDEMGILSIDLNKINFNDANFDEDDPETLIHVRPVVWHYRFNQRKACKKDSKEVMPVPWHLSKWWDWCMSEDEKKEIEPFLIDEKQYKGAGIVSTKINVLKTVYYSTVLWPKK